MKLEGDVALITGASKGIGRVIGLGFAKEGAKVAVNYNTSLTQGMSVVEEIRTSGGEAIGVRADITNAPEVNRMVTEVMNRYGRIDILVSNAGMASSQDFLEMAEGDWDHMMITNLKSAFLCCQAVGKIMRDQGGGRIVTISSGLAVRGAVKRAHYAASKAGIIALTRSIALELAPYHIRVNSVAPGFILTDLQRRSMTNQEIELMWKRIPVGKVGSPEDVANAVLFLASKESSFITGTVIYVDGGGTDALDSKCSL